MPNISVYLPLDWQHGAQWAPDDKEGMCLHRVLPSASQPETNLTLKGVTYTGIIEPPGYEDQVFLRPTGKRE
ncbi:hypothetical protein BE61_20640 [Bradyrhizobium elkanii USDA 61]|nr:hypothetical protein BE61_20640 [Bradyrhizobium elkanii USDA 61]